jgi:hypothetical protein
MGLNLTLCTAQRLRSLPRPVLVVHLGAVLTLGGAMLSSFGFIATVNIYEGTAVDSAYRWDLEHDVPLGFTLAVKRIETEYHPIPVKVGVLKDREKIGLFELKTGKSLELNGYTVKAESLAVPEENLRLSVFQAGRLIGSCDTDGARALPVDFPYDFRLVAYKNPSYKRVGVDLAVSRGSQVVAEGITEVNSPFEWKGLYFYHTNIERDEYGNAYAGIQIVRDPGKPVVFIGFAVILTGSLLWVLRKFYGFRRP